MLRAGFFASAAGVAEVRRNRVAADRAHCGHVHKQAREIILREAGVVCGKTRRDVDALWARQAVVARGAFYAEGFFKMRDNVGVGG